MTSRNCWRSLYRLFAFVFLVAAIFGEGSFCYGDLLGLKGEKQPLSGIQLQSEAGRILFGVRRSNGEVVKKWFQRDQIDFHIKTIPVIRKTETLKEKVAVAERLCEMKKDWEARYKAQEILNEVLSNSDIKNDLRCYARWLAFRYSLSNKMAWKHLSKGLLLDRLFFEQKLREFVRLPFPDLLNNDQASNWAEAIRLIRFGELQKGRQALKKLTGSYFTDDLNQFASLVSKEGANLGERVVEEKLLKYELMFLKAARAD